MKLVVGGGNQRQGKTSKNDKPTVPIAKVKITRSNRHSQDLWRERLSLAKVAQLKGGATA